MILRMSPCETPWVGTLIEVQNRLHEDENGNRAVSPCGAFDDGHSVQLFMKLRSMYHQSSILSAHQKDIRYRFYISTAPGSTAAHQTARAADKGSIGGIECCMSTLSDFP